jgi:hypothetical protein
MTMQSAPTGIQLADDVTEEAMVALATTGMPGAILQASGPVTDGDDSSTHAVADKISGVIVETDPDAAGGVAVSPPDHHSDADEPTHAEMQTERGVAPDDFHAGSHDETADDEDYRQPDISGGESDGSADSEGPEVEGVSESDAAGTPSPDDSETEVEAVATSSTTGSDDEGHCHETNDGATASPSTQVGTAAADNVTLKTAAGNDDAVEGDSHEVRATAMTLTEVGDVTPGVTAAVIGEVTPAASSTDNLHATEDSDNKIDDRRFQQHWYGHRTAEGRAALRTTLLTSGKHVAHVDDEDNLLSDPEVYRMARDLDVPITKRVHRGWNHSEKLMFIFKNQGTDRVLTTKEHRKLRNERMRVMLLLEMSYDAIAQRTGVSENTVRSVEDSFTSDTNSKSGIRKKDRRVKWSTPENIAEARRLRAEKKTDSEIAKALGTTSATISKLFQDPATKARKTNKHKPGKKQTASRNTAPMPLPPEMTRREPHNNTMPIGHVPWLLKGLLKHLRLDTQAYDERRERSQAKARRAFETAAGDADELLDLYLYGISLPIEAHSNCEVLLDSLGKVRDALPDGSLTATDEHEAGNVGVGTVKDVKQDGKPVGPPDDDCVIDESHYSPPSSAKPDQGNDVRASVINPDADRDLVKRQASGQPLATPHACANAMTPNLDDRMSPHVELADRKAGPQAKAVSR